MTTQHPTADQADRVNRPDIHIDDLLSACDVVMHALVAGEDDRVALAAEPFKWQVAYRLIEDRRLED